MPGLEFAHVLGSFSMPAVELDTQSENLYAKALERRSGQRQSYLQLQHLVLHDVCGRGQPERSGTGLRGLLDDRAASAGLGFLAGAVLSGLSVGWFLQQEPPTEHVRLEEIESEPSQRPSSVDKAVPEPDCDCDRYCDAKMALSGCEPARTFPPDMEPGYQPEAVQAWTSQMSTSCDPFKEVYSGLDCDSFPCLLFFTVPADSEERFIEIDDFLCDQKGPRLVPGPVWSSPFGRTKALLVTPNDDVSVFDAEIQKRFQATVSELHAPPE
jgi:hypothetical protein